MIRTLCNRITGLCGMKADVLWQRVLTYSLERAMAEQGLAGLCERLRRILYRYPRSLPGLREAFARLWHNAEFEGFSGAILEKDTTCADCYKDWEE